MKSHFPSLCFLTLAFASGIASATVFTVATTNDSGSGSLRQAILDANADASATVTTPHQIRFNIGGGGAWTITCVSELPPIARPTQILGNTQPGFSGDPLITITFSSSIPVTTNGLVVEADSCLVDALAIHGFGGNASGIVLSKCSSVTVDRCRIGCDRLALNLVPLVGSGTSHGLLLTGGGSHLIRNCVIAGTTFGVTMESATSKNQMQNNDVGVSPTGDDFGCAFHGVTISADSPENEIGPGNVIAFNGQGIQTAGPNTKIVGNTIGFHPKTLDGNGQQYGVRIESTATAAVVGQAGQGNTIGRHEEEGVRTFSQNGSIAFNFIGMTSDGDNVKNHGDGIRLEGDADGNVVADNHLFFNLGEGIQLEALATGAAGQPDNCQIRRNRCGNNGGLGINLRPVGEAASIVTANDQDDPDSGPNDLQNFPVITGLVSNGTDTTISGKLNVSADDSGTYRIDIFRSLSMDPSGHGEGEVYLGTASIAVLGGAGNTDGTWSLTVPGHFPNQWFTATATLDSPGKFRSSEYSEAMLADPGRLAFSVSTSLIIIEGNTASASVSRSGGTYGPVSVTVNAVAGTAEVPADFTPASLVVNIPGGASSGVSSLFTAVDDTIHEGAETLSWQLVSPTGGATLASSGTTRAITILDNDPSPLFPPGLRFENAEIDPGDAINPPALSGTLVGGEPDGVAEAEVSSDLGIEDPWQVFATVPLDGTGSAAVTNLAAPPGRAGAKRLFFRFRQTVGN
jgi:hypothetical protein